MATLRGRLAPGSRALVAQDFRHAAQRENEAVADYMSRLEQLFRRVFGKEDMSDESREPKRAAWFLKRTVKSFHYTVALAVIGSGIYFIYPQHLAHVQHKVRQQVCASVG